MTLILCPRESGFSVCKCDRLLDRLISIWKTSNSPSLAPLNFLHDHCIYCHIFRERFYEGDVLAVQFPPPRSPARWNRRCARKRRFVCKPRMSRPWTRHSLWGRGAWRSWCCLPWRSPPHGCWGQRAPTATRWREGVQRWTRLKDFICITTLFV